MAMAGRPKMTTVGRQPSVRIRNAPSSGTKTVPRLPPAMCAEMAKPRRSGGNCSDSKPLPTGCCGEEATREVEVPAGERQEAAGERLAGHAGAEDHAADRQDRPPSRTSASGRCTKLDQAGRDVAGRGKEHDRRRLDLEVVNDRDVDQRQHGGLRVVDGVGGTEQPQRPHRTDLASGHRAGVLPTRQAGAGRANGVAAKLGIDGTTNS